MGVSRSCIGNVKLIVITVGCIVQTCIDVITILKAVHTVTVVFKIFVAIAVGVEEELILMM